MRRKIVAQQSPFDHAINVLVSILKPEKMLKKMDTVVDENPDIERVDNYIIIQKKEIKRGGTNI